LEPTTLMRKKPEGRDLGVVGEVGTSAGGSGATAKTGLLRSPSLCPAKQRAPVE
jgi:hypothetical protein